MRVIGKGLLIVGLASGTAAAGPFINMHRQDATSKVGAELTYHVLDDRLDGTLMRFELHGQYMSASTGLGAYAQVPIGYVDDTNDTTTAVGNVELGGMFLPRSSLGTNNLIVYAGLTLPTSDDQDAVAVLLAHALRPHDLYLGIPKGVTGRVGISPMYENGNLYARLDLAADIMIDATDGFDKNHALELNIGVGAHVTQTVTLTGEISTITVFGDDAQGDLDPDNITVLGIGARFNAGNVSPYLGVLFPLDDDVNDIVDLGIMLGIEGML